MPAGEQLSAAHRADIERQVALAERQSGLPFSVYLGPLADGRASAEELHATLHDPARAVLVAIDPAGRRIEIVTGAESARWLDDRACRLAAMSMTTSFSAGDLAGGVRDGLGVLAEHARHPRVLHTDEPW
ncbi:MAG: DUF5130 family protein [Candidatus Nanopelagicales bacterium]